MPRSWAKLVSLMVLMGVVMGMAGCGFKGPLQLPDAGQKQEREQAE